MEWVWLFVRYALLPCGAVWGVWLLVETLLTAAARWKPLLRSWREGATIVAVVLTSVIVAGFVIVLLWAWMVAWAFSREG